MPGIHECRKHDIDCVASLQWMKLPGKSVERSRERGMLVLLVWWCRAVEQALLLFGLPLVHDRFQAGDQRRSGAW